ncbi:unnamed protein product [Rotaria sp. Silwood2]|nr:unnamed protein product [Rotaria sp. Silwood2]CAF2769292.1 unnamed protein product [Rotaria sp. Silwood2]CAF3253157.1 unnamed protein product [Rotaria sp. Silwood2]CAF4272747.1 unnamed protein product [Rotaria sp. Silwood2]CAF4374276.1 unnamed protein product [Rotaria sp. Silwood2]
MSISLKPQNTKAAATKRIMRDLRDLDKIPIPGLGVCCPDESNPFLLHCNVLINDGPYRGIMIHLVLHIPEDYPLTGPAGNIAPGLEFDQSPGYTLSTALLQIVTFFADPDLYREPTSESIDHLRMMVKEFHCRTCGHSYKKPNPEIIDYSTTVTSQDIDKISEIDEEKLKIERLRELKEKLTCGITKQNFIDDPICLGYPLLVKRDNYGRLWPETILELISYDAYVAEIQKSGENKLDYYEHLTFRSVTGKDYNHWLPIFINEEHFRKGQTIIQNSISVIYNGTALGSARYDFKPIMALNVLTTLMNKSSVQLFNGQMFESKHAIEAYCHFLRLLMHFIDIYPELDRHINETIENFSKDIRNRNKKVVSDIGEFLIKVALSKNYRFDQIKKYIYEEYFARQIYWIQRKNIIHNLLDIKINDLSNIFEAVKVSNHLLVFNLEMAETFIFSGVKERLDQAFGYPPDAVVEKFQQRLKAIKSIDRYSQFVQAIRMSDVIKTPDDMINLITTSIKVSDQQGYTRIQPSSDGQYRRFNRTTRYDQQSKYTNK